MVSKNIIVTLFVTAAAAAPETGAAQKAAYNTPGAGNPCLLYTTDASDDSKGVTLVCRRYVTNKALYC